MFCGCIGVNILLFENTFLKAFFYTVCDLLQQCENDVNNMHTEILVSFTCTDEYFSKVKEPLC